MIYTDDLINSLITYLTTTEFTGRGADGVEATGTLEELFPGFGAGSAPHVIPTRMFDAEAASLPLIAISINNSPIEVAEVFGSKIKQYTARLFLIGTAEDPDAPGEKDFDSSVVQSIQLQNLFENHFSTDEYGDPIDRQVPWYQHSYAGDAPVELGVFTVKEVQAQAVDDNKSVVQLALEVIE